MSERGTAAFAYGGILHEVVEHGRRALSRRIVAEDLSLDMEGQARDVIRQLDALLRAYGSDRSRVLAVTIYFADLTEKAAFNWSGRVFRAGPSAGPAPASGRRSRGGREGSKPS